MTVIMEQLWMRKRQQDTAPNGRLDQQIRRQLAWTAGTAGGMERDPFVHLSEQFCTRFDQRGQQMLAQTVEEQERTGGSRPEFLCCFGQTLFQRGRLAGAILNGTGEVMLQSCLRSSLHRFAPGAFPERRLFAPMNKEQYIPLHATDRVRYAQEQSGTAVAIVTGALISGTELLSEWMDVLQGTATEQAGLRQTLRNLYPFLDDSRERELADTYRKMLEDPACTGQRKMDLEHGTVHVNGLIREKARQRQRLQDLLGCFLQRARAMQQALRRETIQQDLWSWSTAVTEEARYGTDVAAEPETGTAVMGDAIGTVAADAAGADGAGQSAAALDGAAPTAQAADSGAAASGEPNRKQRPG